MTQEFHLLIHNIGYILSSILVFSLAVFVYFKDHKPLANKMMIWAFIATGTYTTSHVIATNVSDSILSRNILTFNLASIFISLFIAHCILAIIGKVEEKKTVLWIMYVFSISLTIFFIISPEYFLLVSKPKMYFPNYYDAGILYPLMIAWNVVTAIFSFFQMITAYRTDNLVLKNRLRYLITAFFLAYLFGWQAFWLVFSKEVDPAWGSLMVPSFSIIFTYAVLKYDLLDIRIVAKRGLIYSTLIIGVGLLIILFNFLNNFILSNNPSFPVWIFPLLLSSLVIYIAVIVWKQLRQGDLLKYEFITTITHKFRTPLTHIKWASENMAKMQLSSDAQVQLDYIQSAGLKLVELTDLLVNISENENSYFNYNLEKNNITEIANSLIDETSKQALIKNISVKTNFEDNLFGLCDPKRIKFVMQILLENSIQYSKTNSEVLIGLKKEGSKIIFSVKDSGIGIPKEEFPLLFSKFHRSKSAMLADTEGMGIGLFTAKEIMKRHRGSIWAESEGFDKGSVFYFSIPAVR